MYCDCNPCTIRVATVLLLVQIALAIARTITGHIHTSKGTDYCPNCTRKCVISYTNRTLTLQLVLSLQPRANSILLSVNHTL